MKGEDMDDYVAKFERLAQHAGYNLDNIQTLDLFTAGLPNALYQKVYELDNPQNYAQWKHHALECQCQWLHVKTHLNKFRPTTCGGRPRKVVKENKVDSESFTSC